MERVGRIEAIWRHPVKGMRGERIAEAEVRWSGISGDRRYAFVRGDDDSHFPWFTARTAAGLLEYAPHFVEPERPRGSAVRVRSPGGLERAVDDAALLAELSALQGGPLHLLHSGRGLHDASPLSLIGSASIASLCEAAAVPVQPRRFRNNFVIGGVGAFAEENWVGRTLQLGDGDDAPRIRVDRRNERCIVITLDPETLEQTSELLSSLALTREACVGLYASVVQPGMAREGCDVFILS